MWAVLEATSSVYCLPELTFRHHASCILGQAFHYSPENAFYIFNQQIYFIIWYLLDRICTHDVAGQRPATSWVHYTTSCNTQSSAPEDGWNNFPKHVELTGITNKPLLLHLVGCLYYLYELCTVKQISDNEIYLLIKYIKSVLWRVAKRLSYTEEARCLKVNVLLLRYEFSHLGS